MPTGLTYKIYNGEDMSLRSFALTCVRHIGYGYYASASGEKELPCNKYVHSVVVDTLPKLVSL